MSDTQRENVLRLLLSRRGEWVPVAEVVKAGGYQYGARIHSLRHEFDYQIESRTERVRTGRHSHVVRSWFKLLTDREALAYRMANGGKVTREEIDAQTDDDPTLFDMERPSHRDDG
jgi:hypothetical protein